MHKFRAKAVALTELTTCNEQELDHIKAQGILQRSNYWSTKTNPDKKIITKFKAEIKKHYYRHQARRCCYCSIELAKAQDSYDAEHIIDKGTHPQFMFEPNNLAIACKPCNRGKYQKHVLTTKITPLTVPTVSIDYTIMHPHLDEWFDHFSYDTLGRIVPIPGTKGNATFEICGIQKLNSARLADSFSSESDQAETFLLELYNETDFGKQRLKLYLLRQLAENYKLPEALAVVDALQEELDKMELDQTPKQ